MPHTRPMALSSPPIDSLIEAIASPHPHGDRKLVYAAFESLPPELVRSLAARAIGQPPRDGYLFARVVKGGVPSGERRAIPSCVRDRRTLVLFPEW